MHQYRFIYLTTIIFLTFLDISVDRSIISIKYCLIMTERPVVELNQDVGCHLLRFLDGIDATNFIEAVNDSRQF